jgi:hypothetical protein
MIQNQTNHTKDTSDINDKKIQARDIASHDVIKNIQSQNIYIMFLTDVVLTVDRICCRQYVVVHGAVCSWCLAMGTQSTFRTKLQYDAT